MTIDLNGDATTDAPKFVYHRQFDMHRWSDYPELNDCLTELVAEVEQALGPRKQARRESSAKRLRDAVRSLVLDLYVAWLDDPELQVGVDLGKRKFQADSRYRVLFLTYDAFKAAFTGLAKLGYLRVVKPGVFILSEGFGYNTKIVATSKLVSLLTDKVGLCSSLISRSPRQKDEEIIILRDETKKKRRVDYTDTDDTIRMRSQLRRINDFLWNSWIDLYLTDKAVRVLNQRMKVRHQQDAKNSVSVDFSAKMLRRIFNNSDWIQGGRFYGGWWQTIPRDYRKFITIEGKETVELDFSGMHPVMLYAEVGKELPSDPYDVGIPSVPRDIIKRAFNALLNTDDKVQEPAAFKALDTRIAWSDLLTAIIRKHEPISGYLKTGYGLRLQFHDSEIAEKIMLYFLERRYVCLPVHDSFIVHYELEEDLKEVMLHLFEKSIGGKTQTKKVRETLIESYRDSESRLGMIDPDITTYFSADNPYRGYIDREIRARSGNKNEII